MLQELYGLYAAQDLAGATEHLDWFARMWEADPLPDFYRVASDIIRWAPEIFNFHRAGGRGHNWAPGISCKAAAGGAPLSAVLVPLTAALIAAVLTGVVGNLLITRRDREITRLKAKLDTEAAVRDYQYEARRTLLREIAPLLFQLSEASEDAYWRLTHIAKSARDGQLLHDGSGRFRESSGYYLPSTIYRMVAPLVVLRLCEARIGGLDVTLEPYVKKQYLLAKQLYRTWNGGDTLSGCVPAIDYSPGGKQQHDPDYRIAAHATQHVRLGSLDQIVDAMLCSNGTDPERCMRYGEFMSEYRVWVRDASHPVHRLRQVFIEFHPTDKPVLWRILLAQAALHLAIMRVFETRALFDANPASLLSPELFDWRGCNCETAEAAAVTLPIKAVTQYLDPGSSRVGSW